MDIPIKVLVHDAEEGGYWAEVPGMPGCVTEAETLDELHANIRDALVGWLGATQDEAIGRLRSAATVPPDSSPGRVMTL